MQARVVAGDARVVGSTGSPYDRLVAWATADVLPATWVAAVRRGRIVAPVRLLHVEGAAPVACIAVDCGAPAVEGFFPGGFVPLTDAPVVDFQGLRLKQADLVVDGKVGRVMVSTPWVRGAAAAVRSRLEALAGDLSPCPTPLGCDESPEDLWWYLVARNPEGLTAATLVPGGMAFGCSDPDGLVLVKRAHGGGEVRCLKAGEPARCIDRLSSWIGGWRSVGKPGLSLVQGVIERLDGIGWHVRAVI